MQGKKVAVFVVAAALTMFISVAAALAFDHEWKRIHGEYSMIATGTCLNAGGGFDPNNNNAPIGAVSMGGNLGTAIWTFNRDKTGKVKGTSYALTFPEPSTALPPPSPSSASQEFSFDFKYDITDDGKITVDLVDLYHGTYITGSLKGYSVTTDSYHIFGSISADHKTITLASGNQPMTYKVYKPDGSFLTNAYNICNLGRVLIRLDD